MQPPHPPPSIHARVRGVLTRRAGSEWLVLPAQYGRWRLPGNPIRLGESPSDTAWRTLHEQTGINGVSEPRLRAHIWSAPTFDGGPVAATYVFGFTAPERASSPTGQWIARRSAVTVLDLGELSVVADLADPLCVPAVDYREHLP